MFSIYNELKDNSQGQINRVIAMSIGSAAFVYEAIAILGYLTFGKEVLGNIILECKWNFIATLNCYVILIRLHRSSKHVCCRWTCCHCHFGHL